MQAYGDLGMRNALEVGCNPVIRRPLLVSGHDTEVMMDFLEEEGDGGGDGNLCWSLAMHNHHHKFCICAMNSWMLGLRLICKLEF